VKDTSKSVYTGLIKITENGTKTEAFQTNRTLTLSRGAWAESVPNLEIETNDVKCSHGSTSGAIDETALYYLRSRGVPLKAAQSLLVLAFLAEAIAEIEDEAIADDIRNRLEGWLHRHEH
jgi:Fe-S cluster assembly protein SufD